MILSQKIANEIGSIFNNVNYVTQYKEYPFIIWLWNKKPPSFVQDPIGQIQIEIDSTKESIKTDLFFKCGNWEPEPKEKYFIPIIDENSEPDCCKITYEPSLEICRRHVETGFAKQTPEEALLTAEEMIDYIINK